MSLVRLSLVGLLGLAACGGSNSSSLGATPATLDNSAIGTFGTLVALSARMGAGARFGPFLNLVSPSVLQQTGCLSGNATFTLSATGAGGAGPVTGNANYASFDNCYFLPLNGTATVTGTLAGSAHVDSFTLEFANFAYSPTGSSQVFRASGKMVISWKPSVQGSAGYLMRLDAVVSDENQKPVFRLDGFRIDSDLAAGIENMLVAGRLTTDRGFVDVSSTNRLELSFPSHGFGSGSLDITGASQVATLTYIGEGTFTAQIRPKA
ncbi:MAG: hypothetical protein ACJ79V_01610 [Myxococcales bacterium]